MSDPVTVEDLISQMTTTATELQRAQVTVNTAETTIVAKAAQIAAAADTIAAIGPASTSEAGTVQLSNAIDSTDETLAATPKAVKTAYDLANSKYSAQDASTTQKGIVKLNSSVTSTLTSEAATASAVKQAYDLANTANTAVANKYTAQDATTTQKGIVQLSNSTSSTSTTLAATASAVKAAYDLANGKSTVSFTPTLTSGTEIGTITINGQSTTLYCEVGGGSNVNVVEVPTISGPSTGPIGYNVTFSLSAEPLLSGATIASFTYGWQGSATSTATATSNAASVTLTVPASTTAGSNLTLVVTATDSLGNVSQEASKVVQAVSAYVNKPSVTAPSNGASLMVTSRLTVTLSAFGVTNATDTYASSDFYIYSNSSCTTLVASKKNYSGKSYSFTASELSGLTIGNTYYIKGRHRGVNLGYSELSDAIAFTAATFTSGNASAVLYTNANNTAIIMEWDSVKNTHRKVAIAKAAARPGKAAIGAYGKDLSLTNFNSPNANSTWYADGSNSNISQTADCPQITNAEFKRLWANLASDGSMKSNCDTWLSETNGYTNNGVTGSPAITAARAVTIDGVACDIPDEECLIMMFLNAEAIDSLDDTAVSNPTKALGKNANPSGRFVFDGCNRAWSCTEYGSDGARGVDCDGLCGGYYTGNRWPVLPARELS